MGAKQSFLLHVLAVLAVIVCHTRGRFYTHEPKDVTYYTSSCPSNWCGEKWKADRILYYNYTIDYIEHSVTREVTIPVFKCPPGAQDSHQCKQTEPITEVVNQIVRTEVKNRTLDEIVKLPQELSLGFILTDNMNTSRYYLNESYQLNQDKIWQIRIPRQCRMTIYFQQFDLEPTEGCVKDYFTIQTSKAQKNFPKYCNSLHRVEIRNRRRVQMWFHSDETTARRGIFGTFCFSKWPASKDDTPCNCNLVHSRRQRSLEDDDAITKAYSPRQDKHLSREHTAAEDDQVGEWLISMMQNGPQKVEEYLHYSSNPKQRLLAQKYQEALNVYSKES